MVPASFIVVVDANVLFPLTLRDTVLRAAAAGFYQLRWSAAILDEMERNLVSTNTMAADKAARLRATMESYFPEAEVTGYESLVAGLQNDEKDRHVVAAAVKAGAQVITTSNLKDFAPLPEGLEAQSPDEFLCNLFDNVRRAGRAARARRARPRRRRSPTRAGGRHTVRAKRGPFIEPTQSYCVPSSPLSG